MALACCWASPEDTGRPPASAKSAVSQPAWTYWKYFPNRTDLSRDGLYTKSTSFQPPKVIERVNPTVPSDLPSGQYRMRFAFVIETSGRVRDVVVIESSGLKEFDQIALRMILDWRFAPAKLAGKEIAIVSMMPFELSL